VIVLVALLTGAMPAGDSCGIPDAKYAGQVYDALAHRAADAVERAGQTGWTSDPVLSALVAPDAGFNTGSGDVGVPLANGPAGLRALALGMSANRYRFRALGGIPGPAQPCAEQKVELEFVNTRARTSTTVTFTFVRGRIVRGAGWQGAYSAGPLKPAQP